MEITNLTKDTLKIYKRQWHQSCAPI